MPPAPTRRCPRTSRRCCSRARRVGTSTIVSVATRSSSPSCRRCSLAAGPFSAARAWAASMAGRRALRRETARTRMTTAGCATRHPAPAARRGRAPPTRSRAAARRALCGLQSCTPASSRRWPSWAWTAPSRRRAPRPLSPPPHRERTPPRVSAPRPRPAFQVSAHSHTTNQAALTCGPHMHAHVTCACPHASVTGDLAAHGCRGGQRPHEAEHQEPPAEVSAAREEARGAGSRGGRQW